MNKEQFLNTGLLEQYALGVTNEEETQTVEQYLEKFPELQKEVDEIRKAIENYAIQQAVTPPKHIKPSILSTISNIEKAEKPASESIKTAPRSNRWVALTAILSFAATFALFFLYAQKQAHFQDLSQEYAKLQMTCEEENNALQAQLQLLEFIKDPETKKIYLNGLKEINDKAIAYWNPVQQKVIVNLTSLPDLPADKQYQIWGDVDHVMVDAGLLEDDASLFQEIKFLADDASLNITVEPVGGSEEPTVSELVVAGEIG